MVYDDPMAAPCTMVVFPFTRDGTGDAIGEPPVLATFCVTDMITGVVTVLRTAARIVIFPLFKQL